MPVVRGGSDRVGRNMTEHRVPRDDLLVSVGLAQSGSIAVAANTIRDIAARLSERFRYWEIVVIADGNQFATIDAAGTDPTATADTGLQLLEGSPPIYSIDFASMMVDGAAPTVPAPASGRIGTFTMGDVDWTADWTWGIHDGRREVPLWFE